MENKIGKTMGFKDMHDAQVKEFMDFCCHALDLAESLSQLVGDDDISDATSSRVEAFVEMFGGNTLILRMSPSSSDSEPESD